MKMHASIIDFNGMQFRSERSIDERLRAKTRGKVSTRRRKNNVARNVRGTLDQILGW